MSSSEPDSLYAAREPIFPRRVKGKFRTLKWWIMGLTLGVYYLTPWIRWDRGPDLPDQAVLVDMAGRRFFFFMIEILPADGLDGPLHPCRTLGRRRPERPRAAA